MYIFRRYITINLPSGRKKEEDLPKQNTSKKQNLDYTDYEELK